MWLLYKMFCQGNLKFEVDSGGVSITEIGICIISVISNLAVFILILKINHIIVKN